MQSVQFLFDSLMINHENIMTKPYYMSAISSLHFSLFLSITLSSHISFCCQTKGSSLCKCTEVWPTKHKGPEDRVRLEEYEEREKGHESPLTVKDIEMDSTRYGAQWQTSNWKYFTHLYPSVSNPKPWYKLTTCNAISRVGPHRGKTGR